MKDLIFLGDGWSKIPDYIFESVKSEIQINNKFYNPNKKQLL